MYFDNKRLIKELVITERNGGETMAESPNNQNQAPNVPKDSTISHTGSCTPQTSESGESLLLDNKQKKEEALKTLERINTWIGNCDTKVSFALAFAGILIGGFFASSIITDSLKKFIDNLFDIKSFIQRGDPQLPIIVLAFVILVAFVIFIGISIVSLFHAIKGKTDSSVFHQEGIPKESNLHFGAIQNKSFLDFKKSFHQQTEESLLNDLLSQVHINSSICTQKFKSYNKGVKYLVFSTISFILVNILFLFVE